MIVVIFDFDIDYFGTDFEIEIRYFDFDKNFFYHFSFDKIENQKTE
jgi:hypothetical protein